MDLESLRSVCLSFPAATEDIQWEHDLLFRVGGKMFAGTGLEPGAGSGLSFKCDPERAAELLEREGVRPAPYLARHGWLSTDRRDTLPDPLLKELLYDSYRMVLEKLPKKVRQEIEKQSGATDRQQ